MANERPTAAERFFFETSGYLVLDRFLPSEHCALLRNALTKVIARRRKLEESGTPHTGRNHLEGKKSTRIFYILDDDPLFLELLDFPAIMPYVKCLLNEMPHHHASDAIVEHGSDYFDRKFGWHIDGHDNGFRGLGSPIPFLQLKIGYYLTDMTKPGHGNLCFIPGSHRASSEPTPEDRESGEIFDGVLEVCAPEGSAILFHNALWHSSGTFTRKTGRRVMLYYAYEHPWMIASQEHWSYSQDFYDCLSPERRKLFHGFVFDPPESRWG